MGRAACTGMARRPADRPGHSLPELLVGLVLASILGSILSAVLLSQQRFTRQLAGIIAWSATVRVVAAVLPAETRILLFPDDVPGVAPDTLALRAVRGVAITCGADAGGILVRFRGLREPDPTKDSVVALSPQAGPWRLAKSGHAVAGCPKRDGEEVLRWSLDTAFAAGSVLLLFERGSYHLAADLRYRRGAAGRQPLTPALFDPDATGFRDTRAPADSTASNSGDAAFHILLTPAPDPARTGNATGAIRLQVRPLNPMRTGPQGEVES